MVKYSRLDTDKTPFFPGGAGRPGSEWGGPEIRWLGINYSENHDLFGDPNDAILEFNARLVDDTVFASHVRDKLNKSWKDIEVDMTLEFHYNTLRQLGEMKDRPADIEDE